MKYLITGGSGFLGQHLCLQFRAQGLSFRATTRSKKNDADFDTGDLTQFTAWPELFSEIDVVIHSAAKAHDMSNSPSLPDIYELVNHQLTVRLAENAKKCGVRRFIFISTIKVNGESTPPGLAFSADDTPRPTDEYSLSKYRAEQALLKLHKPGVFEVVILRPCLIYGPGVKANFNSLIRIVKMRIPLPFGSIHNRRSFVSVSNLINLILLVATHPRAGGEVFLASDDEDVSLPELIQNIAHALRITPTLISFPAFLLRALLAIVGKRDLSQRLFGNLQVDIEKTKKILNWKPVISMAETLETMT